MIDIYAEDRARIRERDWGRVHLEGDRAPPLVLPDRRRWRMKGEGMRAERGGFKPEMAE